MGGAVLESPSPTDLMGAIGSGTLMAVIIIYSSVYSAYSVGREIGQRVHLYYFLRAYCTF